MQESHLNFVYTTVVYRGCLWNSRLPGGLPICLPSCSAFGGPWLSQHLLLTHRVTLVTAMTGLLEYLSPLLDFELLKVIWHIFPVYTHKLMPSTYKVLKIWTSGNGHNFSAPWNDCIKYCSNSEDICRGELCCWRILGGILWKSWNLRSCL